MVDLEKTTPGGSFTHLRLYRVAVQFGIDFRLLVDVPQYPFPATRHVEDAGGRWPVLNDRLGEYAALALMALRDGAMVLPRLTRFVRPRISVPGRGAAQPDAEGSLLALPKVMDDLLEEPGVVSCLESWEAVGAQPRSVTRMMELAQAHARPGAPARLLVHSPYLIPQEDSPGRLPDEESAFRLLGSPWDPDPEVRGKNSHRAALALLR